MRIGMICPYSFDLPGGVQAHIMEIAEEMRALGHHVEVLAPGIHSENLPSWVTLTGRAIPVPFNGSVARISFGIREWRAVRRFIAEGNFDVVHVHEPASPSLSMICTFVADGPIVSTVHAAGKPSVIVRLFGPFLRRRFECVSGRIAVSNLARRWQMDGIGGDAVLIPNGVRVRRFSEAEALPGYQNCDHPVVLFMGRYDEPRKGMDVLLPALPAIYRQHPQVELMVIGDGDAELLRQKVAGKVKTLTVLGHVSEEEKCSALRSASVYVAPNTGGESFGIVLVEAMSAGTPVVASNIPAFHAVLSGGDAGWLFNVGNSAKLAETIMSAINDDEATRTRVEQAQEIVAQYDWAVVAQQVLRVYDTVTMGAGKVRLK